MLTFIIKTLLVIGIAFLFPLVVKLIHEEF